MTDTKKDADPMENLIQFVKDLDVPKEKEQLRDQLVKQLQRKDYAITDEKDAAIYIEKVLKVMFEPQAEAKPRFKSK